MVKNVMWMKVVDGKCVAAAPTVKELSALTGSSSDAIRAGMSRARRGEYNSAWRRVSTEKYEAEWSEKAVRRKLWALRYCDRCASVLPDQNNYATASIQQPPNGRTYRLCPSCYKSIIQFVEGDI